MCSTSRPARELERLRGKRLEPRPGEPVGVAAFELRSTGDARLRLLDDGGEVFALDVGGSAEVPTTVLVDGSVVELFRGGASRTERAYPTTTSAWRVDAEPGSLELWVLALP